MVAARQDLEREPWHAGASGCESVINYGRKGADDHVILVALKFRARTTASACWQVSLTSNCGLA